MVCCILFSDLSLQVLRVHVDEIVLFILWFALSAAATAAEATAAAGENSAAHKQGLEPALGHEKVIFDSLLPKLLGHREAHGSILVVDTTLVHISEDGVGIIDLLELLSCFGVVWVLIGVIP